MQIKAEAITKTARADKQGVMCWGIKSGEKWYDLYEQNPPKRGQTINVEVGRDGKKIRYLQAGAQSNGNGHGPVQAVKIKFWDYIEAMKTAHRIATILEQDSMARATLVNTMMISITKGNVDLPPMDEAGQAEQQQDRDIPF